LLKRTSYEAPHYVVFSDLPLPPPWKDCQQLIYRIMKTSAWYMTGTEYLPNTSHASYLRDRLFSDGLLNVNYQGGWLNHTMLALHSEVPGWN